jgi:hypothetical protein
MHIKFCGVLVSVLCRRDGPHAQIVIAEDRVSFGELIRQAKLMLDMEKGCLAVICDDDDIGFIKSLVSSPNPPTLHLHYSTMFAYMKSAGDDRLSPYHTVK